MSYLFVNAVKFQIIFASSMLQSRFEIFSSRNIPADKVVRWLQLLYRCDKPITAVGRVYTLRNTCQYATDDKDDLSRLTRYRDSD
jgi:hypothetical protein